MAGRKSRAKGVRGEREVRDILRAVGVAARRDGRLDDDLVHELEGHHIEVKRRERLDLWGAIEQAAQDAEGRKPIVAFRRNGTPWRGIVDLEYLFRLIVFYTNHQGGSDGDNTVPSASRTDSQPPELVA